MCGGHLLEFLDCHIFDEEGGEMTVNLQHRRVLCKKININYDKNYRKMKGKIKLQRQERYVVQEVIDVVLVGDGNELLEVSRSNAFDQPILGFCHSIPNIKSRSKSLRSGLTVQPCCGIRRVG